MVRPNAVCPDCGAWERHRAVARFYARILKQEFADRVPRIFHLASEKCLESLLRAESVEYVKTSYANVQPDEIFLDLHNIAEPDESVDAFVMNYVLSCTPGHELSVANLYRKLKPGGILLACEPFAGPRTTPTKIRTHDGHQRSYGTADVAYLFEPFEVELLELTADLTREQVERFGLRRPEYMILARKTAKTPARPREA